MSNYPTNEPRCEHCNSPLHTTEDHRRIGGALRTDTDVLVARSDANALDALTRALERESCSHDFHPVHCPVCSLRAVTS